MLVRLAHCCNPVTGDDIVGFITRGRGVSVHRATCPNVKGLMEHPERMIGVSWDNGADALFQVEIVGFITRGRGVSVHRATCPNVKGLMEHPERMIGVSWDNGADALFQVEIVVECIDRMGAGITAPTPSSRSR